MQLKKETTSGMNSEDSLLVVYILHIIKKYSTPENPMTSQDVLERLKEDYSLGSADNQNAQKKKIRRHLDTLRDFYGKGCIGKIEGKTRGGHKWFYDASKDEFALEEGHAYETLSEVELDFIIDVISSSKILNPESTVGMIDKLLKKTSLSTEDRERRLRSIISEEWTKSINEELVAKKNTIESCIGECGIRFDYDNAESIQASPCEFIFKNRKYFLTAKVGDEYRSFSLEKIQNVEKTDSPYDFEDKYFDETDDFYFDTNDQSCNTSLESLFLNIPIIKGAIKDKTGIRFKYLSYAIVDGKVKVVGKDKSVLPHSLVFNDEKYHLIGIDESIGKVDYYRVDLISDLSCSATKIKLSDWNKRIFDEIERAREVEKHPLMQAGYDIPVTFLVLESALDRVIDAYGINNVKFRITDKTSALEKLISVTVRTTREEAFRWALANADSVELISPQDIRDRLGRISEPIHKTYAKTMADMVRENIDYISETGMFKTTLNVRENVAFETYKELYKNGKIDIVDKIHIAKTDGEPGDYFGNFLNTKYLKLIFSPNCQNPAWLSKLTDISSITIFKTGIEDAFWLEGMKKLRYVEISETPIRDLSVLKDHKHIIYMDVNHTNISDISFIENYEHLLKLDISGCPIEDYTPILRIPPLDILKIDEKAVQAIGMDDLLKHHPDAIIEVKQKVNNRKI